MNLLHITAWYPTEQEPWSAIWIERHITALGAQGVSSHVLHLSVSKGPWKFSVGKDDRADRLILGAPCLPWWMCELLAGFLLFFYLLGKWRQFDLVNFHIAYPNLVYWHVIKKIVTVRALITEHWSAYHYQFYVPHSLPRIQRIFRQQIPVITVSEALLRDIEQFAEVDLRDSGYVIPNIVDSDLFYPPGYSAPTQTQQLFMVGTWKSPKQPEVAIGGFLQTLDDHPDLTLVIAGGGPKIPTMLKAADQSPQVSFLEHLAPAEVAQLMRDSRFFLHVSDYETFSVVCAEALTCHCPVIASAVGGITSFVDASNGVLISENSAAAVANAIKEALTRESFEFDVDFSARAVGASYISVIHRILEADEK